MAIKYTVPPGPKDPKPLLVDCTGMLDVLAAAQEPDSYARLVPRGDRIGIYRTDFDKIRGRRPEIP